MSFRYSKTTDKVLTPGIPFDGSGGFPSGGILAGIKPVWDSEIEPFPIRVTEKTPKNKHSFNANRFESKECFCT